MGSQTDDDGCTGRQEHPLQTGYALSGDGSCIAESRRHALAFLDRAHADHRLPVSPRVRDLTQLVVSELVTNARKYAPGPVLMELRITTDSVDVVVWDSDPDIPSARAADPGRIGQHGLEIVKAIADNLVIDRQPVGKRVTARIALTDPSGDDNTAAAPASGAEHEDRPRCPKP
ncbi:ATP-binding protein [Streptomyces sp. NPDC086787]|uniref:ATP-binding protein n=1 Tax=Streptomyces sp. NPDC086787 TaxID=3365759 RepID=UPI003801B15D